MPFSRTYSSFTVSYRELSLPTVPSYRISPPEWVQLESLQSQLQVSLSSFSLLSLSSFLNSSIESHPSMMPLLWLVIPFPFPVPFHCHFICLVVNSNCNLHRERKCTSLDPKKVNKLILLRKCPSSVISNGRIGLVILPL